jgi:hypothetical protein
MHGCIVSRNLDVPNLSPNAAPNFKSSTRLRIGTKKKQSIKDRLRQNFTEISAY